MSLNSTLLTPSAALLLLCVAAASLGCTNSSSSDNSPFVISSIPVDNSADVPVNGRLSATFNRPMDATTLNTTTFLVTSGPALTPVDGTVIYDGTTVTFWPRAHLADNGSIEATITRGAQSSGGVPLRKTFSWQFNIGVTREPGRPVPLGRAGEFVILAKSAISTVPTSDITGDIGISPAAASFITGFSLTMDATNTFSTSSQVTGNVFAADYTPPTPANMTDSVLNMETAFTDAAGRAPDFTELGAGNIGGLTLAPGVYKWGTGLLIPTDVTLSGSATGVWIFQIAQDLTLSSATDVILAGGALPENVFWQVTGLVDLGTTSNLSGVILCATGINLRTGASVNGKLLAQTAVTIDGSTVVEP